MAQRSSGLVVQARPARIQHHPAHGRCPIQAQRLHALQAHKVTGLGMACVALLPGALEQIVDSVPQAILKAASKTAQGAAAAGLEREIQKPIGFSAVSPSSPVFAGIGIQSLAAARRERRSSQPGHIFGTEICSAAVSSACQCGGNRRGSGGLWPTAVAKAGAAKEDIRQGETRDGSAAGTGNVFVQW